MSEVMKSYSTKEKGMTTTRHGSRGALTFLTVPLVLLVACMLGPSAARAQWTTSGNNISNTNTGNVGVGTGSPEETLHVLGNVRVGFGPTTLTKINAAGGIGATDTTLTVVSTASYPSSGTLLLEREAVTYTGKTATTFTGLTRGMFGTVAAAHADQIEVDTYLLNVQIQSSARPKFVVTGKGYVGIGRHAPAASLHIAHSGDMAPIAYNVDTHGQGLLFNQYTFTGDSWRRYTDIAALGAQDGNSGGSVIRFMTNPISTPSAFERMRIDRDGSVGIGTTAPGFKLEVAGSNSRNTMALTGDGDAVGYAGLRIQALTTTGIATNRTSSFNLHMRKDAWYGGDGSGPSFVIETNSKTGGFAAPFLITPNNNVILNGGQGASGLSYGNVGVGTANPAHKLDVAGSVNASGLCLGGTCKTSWSEISGSDSQWTTGGSNIYYGGGNVGIGAGMTSPGEALMVNGKVSINRAATPGPAEFRIFNGGMVAEWSFRQASATSHNLNISKSAGGVYTDYMTIDTAGKVGVGTVTPFTRMQLGNKIGDDNSRAYDPNALMVVHQTPTATATLNDPKPVLYLGRQGTVSQSFGAMATFSLSRYENAGPSNVGSRTRLDIGLTHDSFNDAGVMTLLSNGNVGVGTATPASKLHVGGGTPAGGALAGLNVAMGGNSYVATSNGTVNTFIGSDTSAYGIVGTYSNHPLGLRANNTLAMTLMPDGNVGIGVTGPTNKLDVAGNVNASGLCLGGDCKTAWSQVGGSSSQWTTSGSNIFYSSGNVGVGTNSPGARLDVGAGVAARGAYTDLLLGAGGNNPQLEFYGATKSTALAHDEAFGGLVFYTNGPAFSPSFFVGNAGNVGVGTTAPAQRLHVFGGNVFHQYSSAAGQEYGFYTSIRNNHLTSNLKFDGQWKMMTQGKGAFISTSPLDGNAFSVLADNTSRAANAAATFNQLMVVTMDGNVGVGTANPAHKLDVAGSVNASGLCLGGTCKTTWADISGTGGAAPSGWNDAGAAVSLSNPTAKVGIGTSAPSRSLEIVRPVTGNFDGLLLYNSAGAPHSPADSVSLSLGRGPNHVMAQVTASNKQTGTFGDGYLAFSTRRAEVVAEKMRIDQEGNVGIGTSSPGAKLHVEGGGYFNGDITAAGNISAKYQDVAEWVPSTQKLQAGTVVVLDGGRSNHVIASAGSYDTKVAGVISAQPGVILGVGGEGRVMVATTGRVRVKVDASRGSILVGDLLVTSEVEGIAMKSIPIDLGGTPIHRPGTIIGKALEPLKNGTGEILVLLSLQ
jgi:hypothetical protein